MTGRSASLSSLLIVQLWAAEETCTSRSPLRSAWIVFAVSIVHCSALSIINSESLAIGRFSSTDFMMKYLSYDDGETSLPDV